MSKKYSSLLAPLKLGNTILRNRMTATASMPHFIQGPETFPTEGFITHYANKAKNGEALVTCSESGTGPGMMRGMPTFDPYDRQCQNYFTQQAEVIHFYGSKAILFITVEVSEEYGVSNGIPNLVVFSGKNTPKGISAEEIPSKLLSGIADDFATKAAIFNQVGFDGAFLHMAYRYGFVSRFLSPLTNKRADSSINSGLPAALSRISCFSSGATSSSSRMAFINAPLDSIPN